MRVNVTEQGLIIPKEFLAGIQSVEIRRDRDQIILTSSAETALPQSDPRTGVPLEDKMIAPSRKDMFGIWQGQIWMADDFDAPLDDFEEYM